MVRQKIVSTKNFNLQTRQQLPTRTVTSWNVSDFYVTLLKKQRGKGIKTKRNLARYIIKFLWPRLKSPPHPPPTTLIVSLLSHNGWNCVVKRSWELCWQLCSYWQGLPCRTGQKRWPGPKGIPWSSRFMSRKPQIYLGWDSLIEKSITERRITRVEETICG